MIEEALTTSCTIEAEVSTACVGMAEGSAIGWIQFSPASEPYTIVVESLPNDAYIFEYAKLDLPPPTSLITIAPNISSSLC